MLEGGEKGRLGSDVWTGVLPILYFASHVLLNICWLVEE